MHEHAAIQHFEERTYQIASAICRFGNALPIKAWGEAFQTQALQLLNGVLSKEYGAAEKALGNIHYLARLGLEADMIRQADATLLMEVSAAHRASLPQELPSRLVPRFELPKELASPRPEKASGNISSGNDLKGDAAIVHPAISNAVIDHQAINHSAISNKIIRQPVTLPHQLPNGLNGKQEAEKQEKRRILIMGKIRRSGNVRLKDIQGLLPDTSERMLRYVLQDLIKEGRVERVGNGGTGSYYKIPGDTPVRSSIVSGAVIPSGLPSAVPASREALMAASVPTPAGV
jgi:hypothetical protein